jgi:hypothetical protein
MTCVFCIDVDTIVWLFVCVDVGPCGLKFELLRASWGGMWVGERCWRENVEARPADDERAVRRPHFDDTGVGPSHAPPTDARVDFEDIRCCLEAVLQGMLEGMWLCI